MHKALNKSARSIKDRQAGSKDDWGTPRWFYRFLDEIFQFDLDACASHKNHKHENYYTLERNQDALQLPWGERSFCNPPYGRQTPKFLKKGLAEAMRGGGSVFLIPARPDTKWWHLYVWAASEVWFLEGRLTFETGPNREPAPDPCPFPTCIVVFRFGDLNRKTGPQFKKVNLLKAKESLNDPEIITLAEAKRLLKARQSA